MAAAPARRRSIGTEPERLAYSVEEAAAEAGIICSSFSTVSPLARGRQARPRR